MTLVIYHFCDYDHEWKITIVKDFVTMVIEFYNMKWNSTWKMHPNVNNKFFN